MSSSQTELDDLLNVASTAISLILHNSDIFPTASLKLEDVCSSDIELKAEIAGKSELYHEVVSLLKMINS